MGWLKKVFKRSKGRHSEGQQIRRSDDDRNQNQASTSSDSLSKYNEDLQRALALSLSEEEKRKAKAAENKISLEEDELLARTLQESLDTEFTRENGIYQPKSYRRSSEFSGICAGCDTEINPGRYLRCMGSFWHPECLTCHDCNRQIGNHQSMTLSGGVRYHTSCYRELQIPKCYVCKETVLANETCKKHPFWNQFYCPLHEFDGTPKCCSCQRLKPRDRRYVTLDDHRKLCRECLNSSIIMDTTECEALYTQVKEFYASIDMRIEQQIPLHVVESQELNEVPGGEKHSGQIRGICRFEHITGTVASRPSNGIVNKLTAQYKIDILILYGLPRIVTGSVLAHEMMHAWLRLNGFRNLPLEVEEGICQVLAYMWLESELTTVSGSNAASTSSYRPSSSLSKKGSISQFERKLGDLSKHHIEVDSSSTYGDGFRAGKQAVLQYGLRSILDHIKLTGSFPC